MAELLLILGIVSVLGLIVIRWLVAPSVQPAPPPAPQATAATRAAAAAQRRAVQLANERRQAARALQVAILQLQASPDFQRAASFAKQAERIGVPAAFRQRQFQRLRERLVTHLRQRLAMGIAPATATAGLEELVSSLGVAAYEAQYILSAAQPQTDAVSEPPPSYGQHLRRQQTEHAQRLEAIRQMPDLDEEILAQLLEAEQERFRTALLAAPDRS